MSSKSRKIRRLNKGIVVEFESTSNCKAPNPIATPSSASNIEPSWSGGQPWHFDFGNSPPRSSGSYRKVVKPPINRKRASESSDDCLPPSQTIESDHEDSDSPSSPVLGTAEPAPKRMRENDNRLTLSTSAARTLNFDEILENQEINNLGENEQPSSPILCTADPALKRVCHEETKSLTLTKVVEKEKMAQHSPIVDIYSDSDDDDIIPATQDIVMSDITSVQSDIAPGTSSDDLHIKCVESKSAENKIADTKMREKASTSRKQMLTGSAWLKRIESRRATKLGNGNCLGMSEDVGQISSASSSSQFLDIRKLDPETELLLSSTKKKKRARFGLVLKLDSILKKQSSDRVLRRHISNSNGGSVTTFGKTSGKHDRKGRIVAVQKIHSNLFYVRCKNLKILPKKSSNFFKVILTLKSADEQKLAPKLISGNDLVISGPWINLENSNFSEEEIITNFEHIEVYDNFITLENSDFTEEILMKRSCECKRNSSNKSKLLSRSKKALF